MLIKIKQELDRKHNNNDGHYKNIVLQLKLSYTFSYYHYKNILLQLTIIYLHRYYHYKNMLLQLKLSYTFTVITTTKTLCYNSNYHIPSQLLPLQKHFVTTQTIIYLHNYYHYKNILLQLKLSYTFTVITTTKTFCYNSYDHTLSLKLR